MRLHAAANTNSAPAPQPGQHKLLEDSNEADAVKGSTGFLDCLSSCCPAKSKEANEEEENSYCGSCGSLAGFFAPLQPCWDALILCVYSLWESICIRLQGNADPVQKFIDKWRNPENQPNGYTEPADKDAIAAKWASEFAALPEDIQKAAFDEEFCKRRQKVVATVDLNTPEGRKDLAEAYPCNVLMLANIEAAYKEQRKQGQAVK